MKKHIKNNNNNIDVDRYDDCHMFNFKYLNLSGVEDRTEKWTHYSFEGYGVPRVSEILDATIGKSYLNAWAASLGDKYQHERMKILDTGSMAHEMIEDFLVKGYIKESYNFHNADTMKAYKSYHNFVKWWNDMRIKGYKIKILAVEKVITCPFYGGTCDCIASIEDFDGIARTYVLDFKTSKSIDYSYFLQTMLYLKGILYNQLYVINDFIDIPSINGVGVIRVDKEKDNYEYLIADYDRDYPFIYRLEQATSDMINWFYEQISVQYEYKQFRNNWSN